MVYSEVVKKAQKELKARKEYHNNSVSLYACDTWLKEDQINLWTYWQGYQIKDIDKGIDILLVGQDWGNPQKETDTINRIKRIQSGDRKAKNIGEHLSPTDNNLIMLDNYPIYDSVISESLPLYLEYYDLGKRNLKDYVEYRQAIDDVIDAAGGGISRNGLDHLMWYFFK